MGKIQFTNIIIDDFSIARQNLFNKYVHFLTHIHTDHLKGLSNTWQYGKIYCSSITKQLIVLKFPKLYDYMQELELQVQHTIKLAPTLQVTVTLFDANHCPGATMVLIQGYMGTILYTGDIRFDRKTFQQYTYLYPHNKRNKQFKKCSRQIDYLYLDNTFLHPKFTFPPRQKAIQILDDFIQDIKQKAEQQNKFIDFYIGMDMNGKEEVLVHLANRFQTLIVVSQFRFNTIRSINVDCSLFTTNPQEGFIHVVAKSDLKQYTNGKQNAMGIILTGWANSPHYRYKNVYAVPYSLHSSYNELKQFVDSIRPSVLEPIVQSGSRSSNCAIQISGLYQQISYTQILDQFRKQYCGELSPQLQQLTSNIDLQKKIKQRLGLDRTTEQINMQQFGLKTVQMQRPNNCTGFKLNTDRDQQQILAMKKTVDQLKKKNLARKIINKSRNGSNSLSVSYNNQKNEPKRDITFSNKMQIQSNQIQQLRPESQNVVSKSQQKSNHNLKYNQKQNQQQKKNQQCIFQQERAQIQNLKVNENNDEQKQIIEIEIQDNDDDNESNFKKRLRKNVSKTDNYSKEEKRTSLRNKSKSKQIQTKLKVKKPFYYVIDEEQITQNGQISIHNQNQQSSPKMKRTFLQYQVLSQKSVQQKSNQKNYSKNKKLNLGNQIELIQFDNHAQMNQIIKNQLSKKLNQQQTEKQQEKRNKLRQINQSQDLTWQNQFFQCKFWKERYQPVVKNCKDINIFQINEQKMKQIKITSVPVDLVKIFKEILNKK